jgi:hypothetical protein
MTSNILKAQEVKTDWIVAKNGKIYDVNLPGKIPFYSDGYFSVSVADNRQVQMRLDKDGLRVILSHKKSSSDLWRTHASIVWKNRVVQIWGTEKMSTPYFNQIVEFTIDTLRNSGHIESSNEGTISFNYIGEYPGNVEVRFNTTYTNIELWLK